MANLSTDDAARIAFDHAWNWFEYHANQRMTMIRFYLIVAGAIATGVGYLWSGHHFLLSALVSSFGILSSYCFCRLDLRVSRLIKLAEVALKEQQKDIAKLLSLNDFEICDRADIQPNKTWWRGILVPYSYTENIRFLLGFSALAFFIIFCASVAAYVVAVFAF